MTFDVDILIVGGGIAGTSAAAEIAERSAPGTKVTLIESESTLAYHTSSRSAQQLILTYGPDPVRELSARTIEWLREAQQYLADPLVWDSDVIMVGSSAELDENEFPGMKRLDPEKLEARAPQLRPGRFEAGAVDDHSVRSNALGIINWCLTRAISAGAHIETGTQLVSATPFDEGGFDVTLNQEGAERRITMGTIVNAAGAWADQVAENSKVAPKNLVPLRRSAAIVALDEPLPEEQPLLMRADHAWYMRRDGYNILVSPSEEEPSEAEDAKPRVEMLQEVVDLIAEDTTVPVGPIRRCWTGLRTEAKDGVPLNGFDATMPNFFWLAGQGGYGFQTASAMARLAADYVVDGKPGDWLSAESVAGLDPNRAGL